METLEAKKLISDISTFSKKLGFNSFSISSLENDEALKRYKHWIKNNFHGEMGYLKDRINVKENPNILLSNVKRVLSFSLDYLTVPLNNLKDKINDQKEPYISVYAHGNDYHQVIKDKLKKIIKNICLLGFDRNQFRPIVDSAPLMEVEFAQKSGHGWRGKNTLLLNSSNGSFFFLAEILTTLELPLTKKNSDHCGSCSACIDVCPTSAIIKPYVLDARKCISYLTIEHKTSIPIKFREKIGNRVYGCDDCQVFCPWNKFAKLSKETSFLRSRHLSSFNIIENFKLTEVEFSDRYEYSPIKRIGYERWLRNLAIVMGNLEFKKEILASLYEKVDKVSEMVKEHISWAIDRQLEKECKKK